MRNLWTLGFSLCHSCTGFRANQLDFCCGHKFNHWPTSLSPCKLREHLYWVLVQPRILVCGCRLWTGCLTREEGRTHRWFPPGIFNQNCPRVPFKPNQSGLLCPETPSCFAELCKQWHSGSRAPGLQIDEKRATKFVERDWWYEAVFLSFDSMSILRGHFFLESN